jgi:NADP-dependent alcohol dehydrogenase
LPFGTVLTCRQQEAMNSGAVVTIEATKKNWHSVVLLCFKILYMWPNSVFTKRQLQNGVVDAYTHVMEQYLTYPHEGYLQDRIAEGYYKP